MLVAFPLAFFFVQRSGEVAAATVEPVVRRDADDDGDDRDPEEPIVPQ